MERGNFGGYGQEFESNLPELSVHDHPELVFDARKEAAKQHKRVAERLLKGEIHGKAPGVEILSVEEAEGSNPVPLQVAWFDKSDDSGYLLHLEPITLGKGIEGGIMGYKGYYGAAHREANAWKFNDNKKIMPLEQILHAPDGVEFIVKPTADEWSVGRDDIVTQSMGENIYNLYMGLGFLFLGQQWMVIGMHEAGHLFPQPFGTRDEQEAWYQASATYARWHKHNKDAILAGSTRGLFDLLHKPGDIVDEPSIGEIMKYGMTSHALADYGQTRIPLAWKNDATNTMRKFDQLITEAQSRYAAMMS